jgi:hypothetical protein
LINYFKSAAMAMAGSCCLAVGAAMGWVLFDQVAAGAGSGALAGFGVSQLTISIGLVHFVGLAALAYLCFVVGIGLCAHSWCRLSRCT